MLMKQNKKLSPALVVLSTSKKPILFKVFSQTEQTLTALKDKR